MEWWATDLCCMAALTCLYCWDTSNSLLDSEGEEDEVVFEEEEEEAACWRIRCSISCSCWSALTKAAFSRLVCSAFRAFFWLDDIHWSQRMVPAFSFLQREVKSVLHWAQVYGSLGMELAMAAAGPRFPEWNTEGFFRLNVNIYTLLIYKVLHWHSSKMANRDKRSSHPCHASPEVFAPPPPTPTGRWIHYWLLKAGSWTREQGV